MKSTDTSEPPSPRLGVVILAAGQGTRMRSPIPKVLHPLDGRPLIQHVLALVDRLAAELTVVVISAGTPEVAAACASATIVEQAQQLGTGHALLQTRAALEGRVERVLVLYGDTPLIRLETVERLLAAVESGASAALLTAELSDPTGYGRVVVSEDGRRVQRIVEQRAAELTHDQQTLALRRVNSGIMAFRAESLWSLLALVQAQPGGEYYLTDVAELADQRGQMVAAVQSQDPDEVMGINTQQQLADAARLMRQRQLARLMTQGVTIVDPTATYVETGVEVASGTILYPHTHLQGRTRVGRGCRIGPNTIAIDSVIGDNCHVWASVIEGSELERDVEMGPFSHLRPGCYVEQGVELGNYSEAKNSRIGRNSKIHHMSYLGDAQLGADVNIGAGTVTCNYDGQAKHPTTIGAGAFIGSDSMLVAPLIVGERAVTGAGSVVTRDVPADATVVGVPARPLARRSQNSAAGKQTGEGE
jgi:bifunctional UDP-N-acetylglucosamine pyrophosphorylase / glucosamine-1-phosphate N-acetyltransferase